MSARGYVPAAARYLLTGSTDAKRGGGLVHLAARKLIAVQPENGDYRITLWLSKRLTPHLPRKRLACGPLRRCTPFPSSPQAFKGGSFCFVQRNGTMCRLIGGVISGSVNAS